jgi:alkanesulfonate monooxygenase SsuD/methylene tetrahydromethanopterin reductase-like flavin-dependent oxidoreductase (luciferase family)
MKKIGFLSFGHWDPMTGTSTPTAADTLLQTIDLAQAMEDIGADGAFVRVHHFANQLSSPFPLLAAMAARTKRIDLGTGVIDMRYENPLYMAEEAAAADLISGGRLQLGVSRGSPETALNGYGAFGYREVDDMPEGEMARRKTEAFRAVIQGLGVVNPNPQMSRSNQPLAIQPQSPTLYQRIWWGAGSRKTAEWAGEHGYNLMSSTLMTEDTGVPFHELQREQIELFHQKFAAAGHGFKPQTSVSRSILPVTTDQDRQYFGRGRSGQDELGWLDSSTFARFGRSYVNEPEKLIEELREDSAIEAADTLLITVPNQLGVEYNTHLMETIVKDVAPALGWR